jgi:Alkylmercury lyase
MCYGWEALSTSPEEVAAALERLHKKRLLVPEPGNPSRIRMAPPFSGVETSFRVKVQDNVYYANCAWDALGIAAALQADTIIEASDGYSGEPMMLEVRNGQPVPQSCFTSQLLRCSEIISIRREKFSDKQQK